MLQVAKEARQFWAASMDVCGEVLYVSICFFLPKCRMIDVFPEESTRSNGCGLCLLQVVNWCSHCKIGIFLVLRQGWKAWGNNWMFFQCVIWRKTSHSTYGGLAGNSPSLLNEDGWFLYISINNFIYFMMSLPFTLYIQSQFWLLWNAHFKKKELWKQQFTVSE